MALTVEEYAQHFDMALHAQNSTEADIRALEAETDTHMAEIAGE